MPRTASILLALAFAVTAATGQAPDLSANNIIAPTSAVAGGVMTITRDITNIGFPLTTPFTIEVYASVNSTISQSDVLLQSSTSTVLGIQQLAVNIPATLPSGNWFLGFIVLPVPGEVNFSNNVIGSLFTTFMFAAPPDLEATGIAGPTSGTLGSTVSVTRVINNLGGVVAGTFNYDVVLSADSNITTTDPIAASYSSSTFGAFTVNATVPANLGPGTWHWGLVVHAAPGEVVLSNNVVAGGTIALSHGPPVLTGITPPTGDLGGGTTVTLNGSGFTGTTSVTFNGAPATATVIVSSTQLTCLVPPNPSGAARSATVIISTPGGVGTTPAAFTYTTPLPGSVEDVALLSGVNGPPDQDAVETMVAGDILSVTIHSPNGGFDGEPPAIFAQAWMPGNPPAPVLGYPEVHVDPANVIVLLNGQALYPIGPIVLQPGGITLPFAYPGGLLGFVTRIQGAVLTNQAANGFFAVTDAHEVTFQ